jgi:hypothetical protein
MIHNITHLKDTLGFNYLGIKIPNTTVNSFLNQLKEEIDNEETYNTFVDNQQKRDQGSYHITVMNVAEYNKLSKEMGIDKFVNSLDNILKYPIDDLKILGIGTAENNGNRTYFIVCKSEKLDSVLNRYNLPTRDFHITIGFKWKDVYGVRKNEILSKKSKFLKLLKTSYYKNENWNFVRDIKNFEFGSNSEIIPIQITDNLLKIKCENYFMDIGILDNLDFWIMTKYPVNYDLPKLPDTEILKILKN